MSAPESETPAALRFGDLGLPEPLLAALAEVGYESPSPIQAATIPALLSGRDVLGTAQTGTGKTAAFALPILSRLEPGRTRPQALVLAPTRELAIQVAEAFQRYSARLPGFQVLPIYGGQGYGPQLQALRRGVQVVVGTPGRVIDHLERGTLDLSGLTTLVLDEADEMLRMGFIDDVEAVLQKTPPTRQVALFSATMPAPIRRIAQTYLRDPAEVNIAARTTTAANIRQRYWFVSGLHKLDALTRILEAEPFDAMIVFARTKAATEELAGKLQARGVAAAAINGDMQQQQRERTIAQLKDGKLDVLVATDVAARGLDVERISHVLNYDIPYDTESYVHRIGRTGRAGRSGEAILFVTPRERGMLRAIERATRQPIEEMRLPAWRRSTTAAWRVSSRRSPGRWKPAAWRRTGNWWTAMPASTMWAPARSPRRWRGCCKAIRRCCWKRAPSRRRARSVALRRRGGRACTTRASRPSRRIRLRPSTPVTARARHGHPSRRAPRPSRAWRPSGSRLAMPTA